MPNETASSGVVHGNNACESLTSRFTSQPSRPNIALGDDDVLMGRGKRSYNHAGNVKFRALVAELAPRYYETQSKKLRRDIAQQIMKRIESDGGYFLRPRSANGCWEVTPSSIVLTKVKQALRDTASGLLETAEPPIEERQYPAASQVTGNSLQLQSAAFPSLQSAMLTEQLMPSNAHLLALLQQPGINTAESSMVLQALAQQNAFQRQVLLEHRTRQLSALLSYQQLQQLPLVSSSLGQGQQGALGASLPLLSNSYPSMGVHSFPLLTNMANATFENGMQSSTVPTNEELLRLHALNSQPNLAAGMPENITTGSSNDESEATLPFAAADNPQSEEVSEDEAEPV